jgi:hypothetical protein
MEHPDLTYCRLALRGAALQRVSDEAKAAGLEFSPRWLLYVREGQIDNPGIRRVAELKSFIEARPELFPEPAKDAA